MIALPQVSARRRRTDQIMRGLLALATGIALVPLVLVTGGFQMGLRGPIDRLWTDLLPWLAQPAGWDFSAMLATPQARAAIAGDWSMLALFVASVPAQPTTPTSPTTWRTWPAPKPPLPCHSLP